MRIVVRIMRIAIKTMRIVTLGVARTLGYVLRCRLFRAGVAQTPGV